MTPHLACVLLACGWMAAGSARTVSGQEWSVGLVDIAEGDPVDYHRAESLAFLPDSRTIATAGHFYDSVAEVATGEVRLFDAETGAVKRVLIGTCDSYAPLRSGMLAAAPEGNLIAAAGVRYNGDERESLIDVFDAGTGRLVSTLPGAAAHYRNAVAFTSDGKTVVSASGDGTVEFFEARTGRMFRSVQAGEAGIWSLAVAPRDGFFVTGNKDDSVSLWDFASGMHLGSRPHNAEMVLSVALSGDGALLASGGVHANGQAKLQETVVSVWKLRLPAPEAANQQVVFQELANLKGHTAVIYSVSFSPDGKLLASASQDRTVRVWDLDAGNAVATLAHQDFVYDVAFSRDGERLATLGRDALKCWGVNRVVASRD